MVLGSDLMLMLLPQVESGLEDEDPWATEEKVGISQYCENFVKFR